MVNRNWQEIAFPKKPLDNPGAPSAERSTESDARRFYMDVLGALGTNGFSSAENIEKYRKKLKAGLASVSFREDQSPGVFELLEWFKSLQTGKFTYINRPALAIARRWAHQSLSGAATMIMQERYSLHGGENFSSGEVETAYHSFLDKDTAALSKELETIRLAAEAEIVSAHRDPASREHAAKAGMWMDLQHQIASTADTALAVIERLDAQVSSALKR